ncbi:hypothetical protein ACLBR5_11880 [Escherichia coli]
MCSSPRGKTCAVEAFELEAFDEHLNRIRSHVLPGCWKLEAAWQQQQTSSTPAATVTRE